MTDPTPRESKLPPPRGLCLALTWAAAALLLYAQRDADPDLWGHVLFGRDVVRSGRVAAADPYGYTNEGYRWIGHEAGSEVAFWLAWHAGGVPGLIALKMLLGLAALALLWDALRFAARDWTARAAPLLLAAAGVGMNQLVRPQLFTYLFLAALIAVAARWQYGGQRRIVWVVPVVFLLWPGFHGGFVAGLGWWFAFAGLALADRMLGASEAAEPGALHTPSGAGEGARSLRAAFRATRALWAAGAFGLALSFLNPLAPGVWRCLWVALTNPLTHRFIREWSHVFGWWPTYEDFVYVGYLGCAAIAALAVRPRRFVVPGGLALLMAAVAATSYRHVALMALVMTPALARAIDQGGADPARRRGARVLLWSCLVLSVALGTLLVYIQFSRNWRPSLVWAQPKPAEAVRFIRDHGLRGRLYCEFEWGEYLIWHLEGRCRVGMDGRYDTAYPMPVIRAYFRFMFEGDPQAVEHPPADMVLALRTRKAVGALKADPGWRLVYEDNIAALFVRSEQAAKLAAPAGGWPVRGRQPRVGYFPE